MIVIWAPTDRPTASYGSDDDTQYSKEHWKVRTVVRCTTREVYDLAWSPNGEWIIAGSTDNTARIFNTVDGSPSSHFQFWDLLRFFLVTIRSMCS